LKEITPPNLKKTPKSLIKFNDERIDNYYWLRERENPSVIEYLNSENDYYRKMTLHTKIFKTSYS
jgi:oligopeptidase B